MAETDRIGFVGAGQMAEALIRGLLQAAFCAPEMILAFDIRKERLQEIGARYGVQVAAENVKTAEQCGTVVLAVKPQDVPTVLSELKPRVCRDHLIISIAAGVPLGYLEGHLFEGVRVIRVMPNTPCLLQVGCSGLAAGRSATVSDMDQAKSILRAVGEVVEVDEKLLDTVTGLSGSGPAYVFLFAEALIEAGVRMGLPRHVAKTLAAHTIRGAAEMLITTEGHPAELKDRVASPGGTTLAGLAELEYGALRSAVLRAVESATVRSRELGEALRDR